MSEPRFTPAPWVWHTSNSWRRLKREDHGISTNVLEPFVHWRDQHPDCTVSEEDMALIAAAPDLYEALAIIASYAEAQPPNAFVQIDRLARAALAKAHGEKP